MDFRETRHGLDEAEQNMYRIVRYIWGRHNGLPEAQRPAFSVQMVDAREVLTDNWNATYVQARQLAMLAEMDAGLEADGLPEKAQVAHTAWLKEQETPEARVLRLAAAAGSFVSDYFKRPSPPQM